MNLVAQLESILFVAGEPVSLTELVQVLEVKKSDLTDGLRELAESLDGRGLQLVFDEKEAQLVTDPEAASLVSRYRQSELRGSLSPAALETLAIVAYRGPVTRPVIEAIRGVQSSAPLRTLAIRGLIRETGRSHDIGRPILYETTVELLKHLGISSREELPLLPPEKEAKLRAIEESVAA